MRNIVVICLDSVRKDYFDEYAKRLIDRADISVEQCRAASSWSVPSHASMLTGDLPSDHGVHTHNIDFNGISENSVTKELDSYKTACVSANGFTTEEFGFDSLFDDLIAVSQGRRFPKGDDMNGKQFKTIFKYSFSSNFPLKTLMNGMCGKLYWLFNLLPIPSLFDQGAKLVRKYSKRTFDDTEKPVFLFTNFMEGHTPHQPLIQFDSDLYSVPWSWSSTNFDHFEANIQGQKYIENKSTEIENFRQLYSASIDYLDRQVNQFIDELQSQATRETTFIITADHGENLGYEDEDYLIEHSSSLSEGLLHVPFLILNPPSEWTLHSGEYPLLSHQELPQIIKSIVSQQPYTVTSDSVAAEIIGGGPKIKGDVQYWDRMIRAIYLDDNKYIWDSLGNSSQFKYDHTNPCKQTLCKVDATIPEAATSRFSEAITLYKSNAKSISEEGIDGDMTKSTEERLKNLGYL